jgi:molybdopterin synthase catalytic subunit
MSNADWIEISPQSLDVTTAVAFVTDGRTGGIDVFLGTTRAETSKDGRELVALDYEAYEQMAASSCAHWRGARGSSGRS